MNAVVEAKPVEQSAYDRLPRRYKRFVDYYVAGSTGAEAVRQSKCRTSHPRNLAYKLLQLPEIRAAIDERQQQLVSDIGVRQERVMRELYWIATCDPRKLVDGEGVAIPLRELPEDIAACISSVEVEQISYNGESGTRYKYKFWDKTKALDKLGQYLKLWEARATQVNVDARSVTVNTASGAEAVSGALRLLEQVRSIAASATAAASDSDGSVLSTPVRDGPQGCGTPVDAGENSGGAE